MFQFSLWSTVDFEVAAALLDNTENEGALGVNISFWGAKYAWNFRVQVTPKI